MAYCFHFFLSLPSSFSLLLSSPPPSSGDPAPIRLLVLHPIFLLHTPTPWFLSQYFEKVRFGENVQTTWTVLLLMLCRSL